MRWNMGCCREPAPDCRPRSLRFHIAEITWLKRHPEPIALCHWHRPVPKHRRPSHIRPASKADFREYFTKPPSSAIKCRISTQIRPNYLLTPPATLHNVAFNAKGARDNDYPSRHRRNQAHGPVTVNHFRTHAPPTKNRGLFLCAMNLKTQTTSMEQSR